MEAPTLTSSTDLAKEKCPKHGGRTEYYKTNALLHFKLKNKEMGEFYLSHALKSALQEGKHIPLEEIDAIVEGRAVSQGNQAPLDSATSENISPKSQETRGLLENLLEPLKTAFEKIVKELIQELRHNIFKSVQKDLPILNE